MTRQQSLLLICLICAIQSAFAQSSIPDTTFRCLYTQLHFVEPIYPFPANPEVERIVDEICKAAQVPRNFQLLSAAIPGAAAVKDATGNYLVYSPSFAGRLLKESPRLLYAILAHEIGHFARGHRLDGKYRLSEESSADEFMGRALYSLDNFIQIDQVLKALNTTPFAYEYLYNQDLNQGEGLRFQIITKGWNSINDLIKSAENLGYFENESKSENIPLPIFKRSGCPRYQSIPKTIFSNCPKLNDVDKLLSKALDQLGYEQRRYFYVENGFVMLTAVEQINQDGLALQGAARWQDYPAVDKIDGILDYLAKIIFPDRGYFRLFVFYISDQNLDKSDTHLDYKGVRAWLNDGGFRLPESIGKKDRTDGHEIAVMLYEFEATEAIKRIQEQCGTNILTIKDHLDKSGILVALTRKH